MIGGSFVPGVWLGFRCSSVAVRVAWLCDALIVTAVGISVALGGLRTSPPEAGTPPSSIAPVTTNPTRHKVAYALLAVSGLVPAAHWLLVAPRTLVARLLPGLAGMFAWYGLGFGVYVSSWPERHKPGAFDILGASHQLFHVCILFAALTWLANVDTCQRLAYSSSYYSAGRRGPWDMSWSPKVPLLFPVAVEHSTPHLLEPPAAASEEFFGVPADIGTSLPPGATEHHQRRGLGLGFDGDQMILEADPLCRGGGLFFS
mmetsp:Transcript_6745/g.28239  ORF Transcript_6745/g.28239 Transcript_6745/m.28239 type:complete len:259 (-) Transcript_6745:39-815(-)